MIALLKKPSAWIPLALSFAIVGVIWMYVAGIVSPDPTGDEGTGAHLFQLWLILEVLTILFFGIKWLPRNRNAALSILMLQIVAAFIPIGIVFSLQL